VSDDFAHLPYRPCAGVMLRNAEGLVFVGQRMDSTEDAWQMPQGGIDDGETPEVAALRELEEETGVRRDLVKVIAASKDQHLYDLPPHMMGKMWKGRYRGQAQHWFLMQFIGTDSDVNIATAHQEFRAWRWSPIDELEAMIVPFKKELYRNVISEFAPHF
jgi:putative (di)nucleoside polyphosphate hydrolase